MIRPETRVRFRERPTPSEMEDSTVARGEIRKRRREKVWRLASAYPVSWGLPLAQRCRCGGCTRAIRYTKDSGQWSQNQRVGSFCATRQQVPLRPGQVVPGPVQDRDLPFGECIITSSADSGRGGEGVWLRGLDSNQDNQLQRLACYQLHYPGVELR